MKKRYTITLDEDVQERVANHLETLGMTFSGFLNALLCEFDKELQGQPVILDKPMKDLTLEEFGKLASYWIQKASES